jgi:hypothetical protein
MLETRNIITTDRNTDVLVCDLPVQTKAIYRPGLKAIGTVDAYGKEEVYVILDDRTSFENHKVLEGSPLWTLNKVGQYTANLKRHDISVCVDLLEYLADEEHLVVGMDAYGKINKLGEVKFNG